MLPPNYQFHHKHTLRIYLVIYNFFFCRNDRGSGEKDEEPLDTRFSSLPNEYNSEGNRHSVLVTFLYNIQLMVNYFLILTHQFEVNKASICLSNLVEMDYAGNHTLKRELFVRGNDGPGHSTESKYGSHFTDAAALVDSVSLFRLPVGVKNLEKLEESPLSLDTKRGAAWRVDGDEKTGPIVSWAGLTDIDFNKNASIFDKGNNINNSKKQGGLSVRAASMLVNKFPPYLHHINTLIEGTYF